MWSFCHTWVGGDHTQVWAKGKRLPILGTFFTFCVPVGSLVLLQGPYFLCFVQIHARSVNSVYSYENLSVCDYSNLFNLTLAFAKKNYKLHFWVPIWLPRVFFWTLFSKKKMPILHCSHMGPNLEALSQLRAFWG